ncbi:MAG: hypothetical protein IJG68_07685 [Bacilli bacterium]|nr:hypothetical protein [Bacilli bacterium]
MRRDNKQTTTYFILFSLLLIGVIYAILQANLQINGTAKIKSNTWDIHFNNIQVNENSVSIGTGDSPATIDENNNCKVDFEVTLSLPGDFYEFTIDVVNAGTIDGMISTLNKTLKVNNEVVSEVPDYLEYSVTYSDGLEIEKNHKITAGTTETYLVRLEFKTDIEELPEATTISTSLVPQYLQADNNAQNVIHYKKLYDVLEYEKTNGGLAREYASEHQDSFSTSGTKKIYYWYASSETNGTAIQNKNNVIFAGFCWQMLRTTDTGGVKIIYAGVPNNGKCDPLTRDPCIGYCSYNENTNSIAYAGYMYNPNTLVTITTSVPPNEGSLFGNSVSYENGLYTLINTSSSLDKTHHYTCNSNNTECSTIRYYQSNSNYLELNDGRNIDDVLYDMISADNVNQTNSTIKNFIDSWYQQNMIEYTSKLEDVIFCNNREISGKGGFEKNGGLGNGLSFITYRSNPKLKCDNVTEQFSLSNEKARLIYPTSIITQSEMVLLGNEKARTVNKWFWISTADNFSTNVLITGIGDYGSLYVANTSNAKNCVRPSVSLKPGTTYRYGNGSKNKPYIVE